MASIVMALILLSEELSEYCAWLSLSYEGITREPRDNIMRVEGQFVRVQAHL